MLPEEVIPLYESAPDGPLLAGLRDIDWSAERHAFGPATDVPPLLRALVSPNPQHRDAACHGWFERVNHQESVYPACAMVIPFLIALVEHPATPDRSLIALLLAAILAARETEAYRRPRINPFTGKPCEPPADLDMRIANEQVLIARIRAVGAPAVPLLIPFLKNPDRWLRREVALALANHPELADLSVPPLREALAVEPDDDVRLTLETALGELKDA